MKHAHLKAMKTRRCTQELEKPLPDLLAVMSVCNRAHFELVHRSQRRRVSEQRALERESRELKVCSPQTKIFTVM